MAVGVQSPRFSATQSEPDQQDNESCESLVLTVSDGSVHVKSEPCSENEGSGPERNDDDFSVLGKKPLVTPQRSKSPLTVSPTRVPEVSPRVRPGSYRRTFRLVTATRQGLVGVTVKTLGYSRPGRTLVGRSSKPGSRGARCRPGCKRDQRSGPSVGSDKRRLFRQRQKHGQNPAGCRHAKKRL